MDSVDDLELFMMVFVIVVAYVELTKDTRINRRRWWVREVNLDRQVNGYFETCFKNIKAKDPEDFFKHTRMTTQVYDQLFSILQEKLTKCSPREPIRAECRLALTLS